MSEYTKVPTSERIEFIQLHMNQFDAISKLHWKLQDKCSEWKQLAVLARVQFSFSDKTHDADIFRGFYRIYRLLKSNN